ncbi:MAG: nitrous oxide-stimulated promoter family protein, partial [Desulfobulbaceae bacterium]|nr:nitrous oxide-stimulated promoter family protein [Desulfobulbaceae bacterium]
IQRFCRDRHGTQEMLCKDCQALLTYAHQRLHYCPLQEQKTTCGKCPVHCYALGMRQKIQKIMRYAGPRMLLSHPILTIAHLLDGLRRPCSKG